MTPSVPDPAAVERLRAARASLLERIASACARAGRSAADVTLVAVSKTVSAERLVAAVAAGLDLLGENRVQEAAAKEPLVPGARWHLVGPLQSNKARRAVELFEAIEAVDSLELARRLARLAIELGRAPLPIFCEVNVDRDPAKAGFDPAELEAALPALAELAAPGRGLTLAGLMTIGRLAPEPEAARPTFVALRELSEGLRRTAPALRAGLSMGMSDDFEVAIEEGATHVRVGRALFGERPPR